jgi:methylated-DNA-protein-cysteine methyltransferase related protein
MSEPKLYDLIYAAVRQIPYGKVASYGQIAKIVGRCSAQMVGFALAALVNSPCAEPVPWQRVVNSQGKVSPHGFGVGSSMQRQLLEDEGVTFDLDQCISTADLWWLGSPKQYKPSGKQP